MRKAKTPTLRHQGRKTFQQILFQVALLALFSGSASAQVGTSFKYNFVKGFLIGEGYTIAEDRYCLLAQGETCSIYRTFYANTTYKIVAFSDDDDVADVDVFAYNADGTEYLKDADPGPLATIIFSPYAARNLKIVWKNYATNTPKYQSPLYLIVGYR
jgi:hypothetical protein